jgi:hypothetical protein
VGRGGKEVERVEGNDSDLRRVQVQLKIFKNNINGACIKGFRVSGN